MIEGSFELQSPFVLQSLLYGNGSSKGSVSTPHVLPTVADYKNPFILKLHGFWYESLGELCMVGTGSSYLKEGTLLTPAAVLKLHNIKTSSSITSLITGTLESLSPSNDSNYFEPISILLFPQLNYKFTFVSGDSTDELSDESDPEKNLPVYDVLRGRTFCSKFTSLVFRNVYNLQYTGCRSNKKCLPRDGVIANLPGSISLSVVDCSDVLKRVQILLTFDDNTKPSRHEKRFDPNTTLIGEGIWDDKKNQLHVLLCRFLDITNSWSNAHVGDCTTRLSLRFPAIWSIKETSYFEKIVFRKLDRVSNLCTEKKLARNKRQRYPSPKFFGMRFSISIKSSKGRTGWGFADALTVNNQLYMHTHLMFAAINDDFERLTRWEPQGRANISYIIDIKWHNPLNASIALDEKMEITAEGIYDADTGGLCMVGCRKISSIDQFGNASMDCDIILNFQFAPVKGFKNERYIRGRIRSIREKSDLLYFHPLDVSSVAYSREQARHTIWTMDLEIAMVVISQTLACLFVRSQLYHSKRQPNRLPFTSLVMLVILTLGQLIPLVLNYEALFHQKNDQGTVLFQTGGWLEVNEVIVRITSMVAFLLQLHILQQAFLSRSNDRNGKGLWFAEKMSLLVTLPLYLYGAFVVLLADRANYRCDTVLLPTRPVDYWQRSTWDDLKSYAGLISDGFLLPQILFNIFSSSRENALSPSFYIGTSLVRLLPHAYDLHCDHSYVEYKGTSIYANPAKDFFSTAWDVIILIGVLLLAAIIYLQQQFGGCCIIPKRFRWRRSYEKIPAVGQS
ncbi:hypothetical protein ERO13_A01G063950v2 [Gossypium hirsutum]|nr:hypothetical protein ERO13_A01G063950v2 [Gossypium hirsutum]